MAHCKECKKDVVCVDTGRRGPSGARICVDDTGRQWKGGRCPDCNIRLRVTANRRRLHAKQPDGEIRRRARKPYAHLLSSVLVDDIDRDILDQYQWYISKSRRTFYAKKCISLGKYGHAKYISLHSLILERTLGRLLDRQKGEIVDHRNGNGLDNRRANLRLASLAENSRNSRRVKPKLHTKFRGVSLTKNKRWISRIVHNYRFYSLGTFDTPQEAALAYNAAAVKYHGEFATLNEL